jgi:hypothetical protein
MDVRDIPVFIVNKNWLTPMRRLIDWLRMNGTERIVILDNGSTYPPLLNYYTDQLPAEVTMRPGDPDDWQYRFWNQKIYEEFDSPYVMTDPDVVPAEGCPADLILKMYYTLEANSTAGKVGPSLRIDNLPDAHPAKEEVIKGQSDLWKSPTGDGNFYAPIDTTFAIYGRRSPGADSSHGIRLGPPYLFEHVPWYIWPLTDEVKFYIKHANRNLPSGIVWWSEHLKEMQEAMDQ